MKPSTYQSGTYQSGTYQSNAHQAPLAPRPNKQREVSKLDEWLKEQGRRQSLERLDRQMTDVLARQDRQANWLLFFIVLHVVHLIIALIRFI